MSGVGCPAPGHWAWGLLFLAIFAQARAADLQSAPVQRTMVEPLRMDIEWVNGPVRPLPQPRLAGSAGPLTEEGSQPESTWWLGLTDRRLSIVLQRWSAQAGWQLVWEAERDFPIEVQAELTGTFVEVLAELMNSLADTDYPLQAVMNPRNRVVRIRHRAGGGL